MLEINNLTKNTIDEGLLKKVAKIILKEELELSKFRNIELSLVLVSQGKIKKLNKKYLNKNRVTDVLAFGQIRKFSKFLKDELGEIVISPQRVKKNAKKYKTTFRKELTRVFIHGVLHLLDYNHEKSVKENKKMEKKEQYYLKLCQDII